MNRFKSLLLGLALLLGIAIQATGQTALTTTTLSNAVTDTSGKAIVVASATGISGPAVASAPGNYATATVLWVEGEEMFVQSVSGTTIGVIRGYNHTRAATHASSTTVYIVPNGGALGSKNPTLSPFARLGSCTASNEAYLPKIVDSTSDPNYGAIEDCFGSQWQFDISNLPLYKFVVSPNAPRSITTSPGTAGTASSITAQAGGVTTNSGGTGGAGAAASLIGGAGGAASTGAATGGAGGAANVTGGAGGGTITGGNGGAVNITGGAGANGSTAGGTGGAVVIGSGAAGTGGTGTVGAVTVKQGSDTALSCTTAEACTLQSNGTNQNTTISGSGTAGVVITGRTDAAAAGAGKVGEVLTQLVPIGSEVSLSTGTAAVVSTVSLTAGDWDVSAVVNLDCGSCTTVATSTQEISINTGTGCSSPAQVADGSELFLSPIVITTSSTKLGGSIPLKQINVSGTTTVCSVATATFSAGTMKGWGVIIARRRR